MKVFAWVKHKEHPQPDSSGMQQGDICYMYPMVKDQGSLTQRCYFPVVIDLNIPCGEKFNIVDGKPQWSCTRCIHNDPESCDVRKYMQGEWSTGDILNPPKLVRKRMHRVDLDTVLTGDQKQKVLKQDKSLVEQQQAITYAEQNERLKTDFIKKVSKIGLDG